MWRKRGKGEGPPTGSLNSNSLWSEFRSPCIPPAEDRAFPEYNDCSCNAKALPQGDKRTVPLSGFNAKALPQGDKRTVPLSGFARNSM